MPTTDPCVDHYIACAAPFALPVLTHLRGVMQAVDWLTEGKPRRWKY